MRLFTQHEGSARRVAAPCSAGVIAGLLMVLGASAPSSLSAQDTTRAAPPAEAARSDTAQTVQAATPPDTGQSVQPAALPDTGQPAPASDTHTVKKGDTLWDLARQFLGDPFLWPEIYRRNTDVVEDPHWIYPGESLRLPGPAQLVAADTLTPRVLEPEPVSSPAGPTVFAARNRRSFVTTQRFEQTALGFPRPAVRPGEVYAAPWVDREGGPSGEGRLVAITDIPGIAQASDRTRLSPYDRAYVTLPAGVAAERGDRFVVFASGPRLDQGGQLMIPTGLAEVERVGAGEATTVRIVAQYGDIEIGQGIVPLERFSMPTEERPTPVEGGPESQVTYVPSGAVLPSIGHYVILDATARDGIKVGDEFTLYRPRVRIDAVGVSGPVTLPEEPIALAQVVRVTERGVTALVVDQRQPAIAEGVHARLSARMP